MSITSIQTLPGASVSLDWLMGKLNEFTSPVISYPQYEETSDRGPTGDVVNREWIFRFPSRMPITLDAALANKFPDSALCTIANELKLKINFEYFHIVTDPTPVVKTPIGLPDPKLPGAFFTSIYDTDYREGAEYRDGNNTYKKVLISNNIFVPNYRWELQ